MFSINLTFDKTLIMHFCYFVAWKNRHFFGYKCISIQNSSRTSGVPRILEWEGSSAERGWEWGGDTPPQWGKDLGRGHSPENFAYFLLKIPYFDAF